MKLIEEIDKDQLKRHIHKSDLTAMEKRYLEGLVDAQYKTDGRRLIDADAYKHILEEWLASVPCSFDDATNAEGNTLYDCICQLDEAPTIESEPITHARWEKVGEIGSEYRCTNCGIEISMNGSAQTPYALGWCYCRGCGAKMDGEST